MKVKIILWLLFVPLLTAYADGIMVPKGKFLADTAKIGEPIKYILSYYHPKSQELFFPDSTYNFGVFEFVSKEFSSTKTKDTMSLDLAIYTFRTFENKETIELDLPVFIIDNGDTLQLRSTSDNLIIKKVVPDSIQGLSLMPDTSYVMIKKEWNYPYLVTFVILSILFLVVIYLFFGKTLLRNYKLYVIYNNHIKFIKSFDARMKQLLDEPSITNVEFLLGDWKEYLTKLEHIPVNTFTSTEIIDHYQQEDLQENLQQIDRFIYGGKLTDTPHNYILALKKFANDRYKKYRKELIVNE